MSTETAVPTLSPAHGNGNGNGNGMPTPATVSLFQKAHAKIVTLQRIDEQLGALVEQRKKLQDELRGGQALINEEFDRVIESSQEAVRHLPFPPEPKPRRNGAALRLEVAQEG